MPIPNGYVSGQVVQAVPTGINSAFVRVGGASFSSTASVSFANDTFTTTYSTYYVVVNLTASSGDQSFFVRARNNSGAVTGANYYGNSYFVRAVNATLTANNTSANTSQVLGHLRNVSSQSFSMWVTQPANASVYTRWWGQAAAFDGAYDPAANFMGGNYAVNEAHTGLNFFVSGTISGTYSVYALTES